MQIIEGLVKDGGALNIDDVMLVHCRLKNCLLLFSGGVFNSFETHLENCTFVFDGPALRTIGFLRIFGWKPPEQNWTEFGPGGPPPVIPPNTKPH